MADFFWWSLIGLLLVPLLAILLRKKERKAYLWYFLALMLLLQVIIGVEVAWQGSWVSLGSMNGWLEFGRWGFAISPLAGWMFALIGLIGFITSLYAARLNDGLSGSGMLMASLIAVQYIFTSLLLVSQNAIPFLIGWEGMSLGAYAYILTDHQSRKTRHAAFITLTVSELGFLALILAFIIASPSGALNISHIQQVLANDPSWYQDIIFLLGLFGFGVKSGVLPVQLWMPRAYQVTPFHLNAILGGGLLNMGLFGVLLFYSVMEKLSSGLGVFLVVIGAIAVFIGALYALIESKIRMILASSSIENVGFMVISLGLAILFEAHHLPYFAGVAMVAMMFQLTSHALAKALAFLTSSEVYRRSGIDDIDQLGGLLPQAKGLSLAFAVACLSLAAVAPFSGFSAEWLTLQSMLQVYRGLSPIGEFFVVLSGILAALGAAMSLSSFLRLFSHLFTGKSRRLDSYVERRAYQLRPSGVLGLTILSVVVALIGFYPTPILQLVATIISTLLPHSSVFGQMVPNVFTDPAANQTLLSLGGGWFSFLPAPGLVVQPASGISSIAPTYLLWWFAFFMLIGFLASRLMRKKSNPFSTRHVLSWNGGKSLRSPAHQYTATAFSNPHRMFFATLLQFQVKRTVIEGTELAPAAIRVETTVTPWLQSAIYAQPIRMVRSWLSRITRLQHGRLWGYVLTALFFILLLLLSTLIL